MRTVRCQQRQACGQPAARPRLPHQALVAGMAAMIVSAPSYAADLGESVTLPSVLPDLSQMSNTAKAQLDAADDAFLKSDTLKNLLAKSEANRSENRKEIQNKYCYRQAELGIGDCGGLRLIPGMTESGKQKTPDWLAKLLGVENPPEEEQNQLTLKDLFGKKYE